MENIIVTLARRAAMPGVDLELLAATIIEQRGKWIAKEVFGEICARGLLSHRDKGIFYKAIS